MPGFKMCQVLLSYICFELLPCAFACMVMCLCFGSCPIIGLLSNVCTYSEFISWLVCLYLPSCSLILSQSLIHWMCVSEHMFPTFPVSLFLVTHACVLSDGCVFLYCSLLPVLWPLPGISTQIVGFAPNKPHADFMHMTRRFCTCDKGICFCF